jgi:hypothetical protein
LKGLQKDIKFQWVPFHYGVVSNEMEDYLAKKSTTISQISAPKLSFHSAKLLIKRNIQADLSRHMPLKTNTNPRTKWSRTEI